MNQIISFPVARYRFECRALSPIRLPNYAGSTLRGGFGFSFRKVACFTQAQTCDHCGLLYTCPYSLIFETPHPLIPENEKNFFVLPNSYLIEPPLFGTKFFDKGESFSFHFVLTGRALSQLSLLIFAWQQALSKGIGSGNGTAEITRILLETRFGDEEIFILEEGIIRGHSTLIEIPSWYDCESITLKFLTPTRIRKNNLILQPSDFSPRDFLIMLIRRINQIAKIHAGIFWTLNYQTLSKQATHINSEGTLFWRDWTRFSNRQKKSMILGGFIGYLTLKGDLEPFWPFLYLGQWLHAGKNTTFGLGQYKILRT